MKLTKNKILSTITLTTLALMPLSVNAEEVVAEKAPAQTVEATTEFTKAPVAAEITETSVKLEWDALKWAELYVLYYDTESKADSKEEFVSYSNESDDVIFENNYKLEGLEAGKTYYFMVEAYDDNSEVLASSPEAKITLQAETVEVKQTETNVEEKAEEVVVEEENVETPALAIESANATYLNELKVTFNNELDASGDNLFKVADLSGEELPVAEVNIEDKTATLVLDSEMLTSTEYEVVAISVSDKSGNQIEEGVSGTFTLLTPEILEPRVLDAAPEEVKEVLEETTAPEEVTEEVVVEEVKIEDAKELPQTGAKEIIILMMALLLAGVVMQRRQA